MKHRLLLVAMIAVGVLGTACAPQVASAPPAAPDAVQTVADLRPAWSVCEIVHSEDRGTEWWGVYGATSEPRGTTFTYALTVDGETTEYPLVATAGSIYVNGKLYGHEDGYVDDGTNTSFGFTSAAMPSVPVGHQVSAVVTLNGETICS